MRASTTGEHYLRSTNQWSDPRVQLWLYGHDAESHARKVLQGISQELTNSFVDNSTKTRVNGANKVNKSTKGGGGMDEMVQWDLLSSSDA
jgi:hypothetical protein